MVRVVGAHHFVSQSIDTCEVPYAATTAPPDRLLLALSHQVEVRDLCCESKPGSSGVHTQTTRSRFTFPTVDQSYYLSYCSTGNYVASVEKKVTRQGSTASYVRLYTGWESGGATAMRARIAGCVTPAVSTIAPSGSSLDIIELPLRFHNSSHIACCQVTGNIVVICERYVSLYQLVMRTHDISRLKFLDFEPWPVTLELSFSPNRVMLAEDVVAASDNHKLHVFRINKGFARPSDWTSASSQHGSPLNNKNSHNQGKRLKDIKFGQVSVREERRSESIEGAASGIPLDELLSEVSDVTSDAKHIKRLGNEDTGLPVLAMLPSITCSLAHNPARNLRTSPFKPPHSVTMGIAVKETPVNEPWAEQMTTMVESLLQLELPAGNGSTDRQPDDINETLQNDIGERFTSLHIRPVYISTASPSSPHSNESVCPRLKSHGYQDIVAFSCFITTLQEGFLYHFPVEDGEVMSLGRCISTYNFTSNVLHCSVEPYLIHVLTASGLETYTMRTTNQIHRENTEEEGCPNVSDPVCLVGLRPFFNVVDMLMSPSYLVILSSCDEKSINTTSLHHRPISMGGELTVYSLKLPTASQLYSDMLSLAEQHRYTMRGVYSELLKEGHSVLCAVTRFSTRPRTLPDPRLVHLYKESAALLADYHLSCCGEEDHEMGFRYCFMAELKPTQVVERLKKIEAQAKQIDNSVNYSSGLLYYLKRCLCERLSEESYLPPPVLTCLLDLLDTCGSEPSQEIQKSEDTILAHLVLISPVLRQFSTERSIRIIHSHIQARGEGSVREYLSLAVLYMVRSKQTEASQALDMIQPTNDLNKTLVNTLVTYWQIIFDPIIQVLKGCSWDWEGITFSDISVILMDKKPVEFALSLSTLVNNSTTSLQLEHILQVFLTYLPSSVGSSNSCSAGYVLQKFLENVFSQCKEKDSEWKPQDNVDTEALKILMRSYLSDLVMKCDKVLGGGSAWNVRTTQSQPPVELNREPNHTAFNVMRPKFLELVPPLSIPDQQYHPSLINLQCLLCTGWLDQSSKNELLEFVSEYVSEALRPSLFVLAESNTDKAFDILLAHAPQALPLFTREMIKEENELKNVITKLEEKIASHQNDEASSTLYKKALADVLEELARTLPCHSLQRVVPPGEDFNQYILTCQRISHANHIRSVIMATGQKLLHTLNL